MDIGCSQLAEGSTTVNLHGFLARQHLHRSVASDLSASATERAKIVVEVLGGPVLHTHHVAQATISFVHETACLPSHPSAPNRTHRISTFVFG